MASIKTIAAKLSGKVSGVSDELKQRACNLQKQAFLNPALFHPLKIKRGGGSVFFTFREMGFRMYTTNLTQRS
ncbi:MAG: hypothetical protein IKP61_09105 [Spirochaetales bacterium]|nr:hypothetical protein [Spirochaetales bacterium]